MSHKIINMTHQLYSGMDLREHDRITIESYPWVKEAIDVAIDTGHAYGCLVGDNDELIGFGIVELVATGIAQIMIITSKLVEKYPITMVKVCRAMIELIFQHYKLHRLQAFVQTDYKVASRFAEHVGFELEGCMKMFTVDKKDTYLYAIVRA